MDLVEGPFAVSAPTGAVEQAGVVGKLEKVDAIIGKAWGEGAGLAKSGLLVFAREVGFGGQVEVCHEAEVSGAECFDLGFLVFGERAAVGQAKGEDVG